MDPVLKAGLPKLFVLAVLPTTATYTVTVCKEGKNIEHFMEKVQIKRANYHGKKGKYYQAEKKNPFTQQGEGRGKEWKKKGSEVGEETEVCSGLTSRFNEGKFVINGFSHGHGITHHFPATFFLIYWLDPGLIPVQGCGCLSAHTAGHGRQ